MADKKYFPQSFVPIRKTEELLPTTFRTPANKKFMSGVVDPLVQPGVLDKTVGYVGRRHGKTFTGTDTYLDEDNTLRSRYQLEPGVIFKEDNKITNFHDYLDFKNIQQFFNNNIERDDKITAQSHYTWDPPINWDKFVNFREYYWLPAGPPSVDISGQFENVTSTFSVMLGTGSSFIFTPDGYTNNPTITLYRGQTYKFKVNCPEEGFAIRTNYDTGSLLYDSNFPYVKGQLVVFNNKIWEAQNDVLADPGHVIEEGDPNWEMIALVSSQDALDYNKGVTNNGIEFGTVEFTVPYDAPDVLFYQGLVDPNRVGRFLIESVIFNTKIDVEQEILGKETYTSSNEVIFSNGLVVRFTGNITPEKYAEGDWLVNGVGDAITLTRFDTLLPPPLVSSDASEVLFDDNPFDTEPFSDAKYIPTDKDYITIASDSQDGNGWSRYNRWFHKSVVNYAYFLRGQTFDAAEEARAKRPILEFDANLQLLNHGSKVKEVVDYIDDYTTDVFSVIEGQKNYNVDGEFLFNGARILVTADTDRLANNRIYVVKKITHLGKEQITLVEAEDSEPILGECVLIRRGTKHEGKMYHYNGSSWILSQEKTSVNQSPMFDVFDENGVSFSDEETYPVSMFKGTPLVSYSTGNGVADSELGFSLNYLNIENSGDILFNWNWDNESFTYIIDSEQLTKKIATGFFKKNPDDTYLNGWTEFDSTYAQPIVETLIVNNEEPTNVINFKAVDWSEVDFDTAQIIFYKNGVPLTSEYEYVDRAFKFNETFNTDDVVTVKVIADVVPNQGYYEIPLGLEKNPLNKNVTEFTYGQAVDHLISSLEFDGRLSGTLPGNTNLRDISGYQPAAKRFLKHAGSAPLAIGVLANKDINIIKSIGYARDSYAHFKNNFLEKATKIDFNDNTIDFVDDVITALTKTKSDASPWSDSDMVGSGAYSALNYTVEDTGINTFALSTNFSLDVLSRTAVYVYLNGSQLLYKRDYEFNATFGFVELLATLTEGDEIEIREYVSTAVNHIPPTPTALGLYKKFTPMMFVDDTYRTPQTVIQGHDGSITVAFGDYRDELLLELEYRIYNNIKQEYNEDLFDIDGTVGGYYRSSLFTNDEFNALVAPEYLKWVSNTNYDHTSNTYVTEGEPFTYTYSNMTDPTKTQNLPGWWRGVYMWAYDTDRPHRCPWEMLGFSQKPEWWDEQYGEAPYTSNNLLLWEDLEAGRIRQGRRKGTYDRYKRPGLLKHLPVDGDGYLLDPLTSGFATNFTLINNKGDFVPGDVSPAEYAWRSSSNWPFAVVMAMCLLKPFEFIPDNFNRYRTTVNKIGQTVNTETGMFVTPADLVVPVLDGDQSVGLVQYIAGYVKAKGLTESILRDKLLSIDVNLSTRMSGFVDKAEQKYLLDSKSPSSTNNSVFIPAENYDIIFNVSAPIATVSYSGVVVEKADGGWTLSGYDNTAPYFNYYEPVQRNSDPGMTVGGVSATFVDWQEDKVFNNGQYCKFNEEYYKCIETHRSGNGFDTAYWQKVPKLPIVGGVTAIRRTRFNKFKVKKFLYGTKLTDIQSVVDLLLGYEQYLMDQGFEFDSYDYENQVSQDWTTSCKEFMFWTQHNWADGALITLSPSAKRIKINTFIGVADSILDGFYEYQIFGSSGQPFPIKNIDVDRSFRTTTVDAVDTEDGIYFLKLFYVLKEHVTVFSDRTVFNDVIYDETTGYRQERIKSRGYRTTDWDGDYTSPGFIFDNVSIASWEPFKDYKLGDIVSYKSFYWTSQTNQFGQETFDNSKWEKTDSKLKKQLVANFDYKINQIEDYYNVTAEGIGSQPRALARHAVGYQQRQYLQDLAEDPTTQFLIYQGFVREKGTNNAIVKVFDKLSKDVDTTVELNEEWAFRVGNFGGVDQVYELEFNMPTSSFEINPQPISLVEQLPKSEVYHRYHIVDLDEFTINTDRATSDFFPVVYESKLPRSAGYVKPSQVDYLLTTRDELLNIDVEELTGNEYVWITFDNKDAAVTWTVLRYNYVPLDFININVAGNEVTIHTFQRHTFVADDLISIRGIDDITGIFKIVRTTPKTITLTVEDLDEGELEFHRDKVIVGKFFDSRSRNVDEYGKSAAAALPLGGRHWIDQNKDGLWEVIEKQNVYIPQLISKFGVSESRAAGTSVLYNRFARNTIATLPFPAVTATYLETKDGLVVKQALTTPVGFEQKFIESKTYGTSLAISPDGKWLAVGSPDVSNIPNQGTGGTGEINQGVVCVYREFKGNWQLVTETTRDENGVVVSPNESPNERFGYDVAFSYNGVEYSLHVTAPGYNNNAGRVYTFTTTDGEWDFTQSTVLNWTSTQADEFGLSVATSSTGLFLAVGAPEADANQGAVEIFTYSSGAYTHTQTIQLDATYPNDNSNFGYCVEMSNDGKLLLITAPEFDFTETNQGAAFIYKYNNTTEAFELTQDLRSYADIPAETFGISASIDDNKIVIGAKNTPYVKDTTFDEGATTFDEGRTNFSTNLGYLGAVYVFEALSDEYFLTETLLDEFVKNESFGHSVYAAGDVIAVGSPFYALEDANNNVVTTGNVRLFRKDPTIKPWTTIGIQEPITDLEKIKSVVYYDTENNQLLGELDFVDNAKMKVLAQAEQELTFKTIYDPAIYTIGTDSQIVNEAQAWAESNVGKLWWDISAVKWINADQGDFAFKVANWNTQAFGSEVKVYEWVETKLLPSEWAEQADTAAGLAAGISGTPRFADDTVYSKKDIYNSITENIEKTLYYYWVENTVVVPNDVTGRRISAADVSQLISNPRGTGLPFVSFIGKNRMLAFNMESFLSSDTVSINVQCIRNTRTKLNSAHNEYLLLTEGIKDSVPNAKLEEKWIDSLVGSNASGARVPDTTLSDKQKYGLSFRPVQSMFVNRFPILQTSIEHINSILEIEPFADTINFEYLNDFDEEPSEVFNLYDIAVDTRIDLEAVGTIRVKTAKLQVNVVNGFVDSIDIVDKGFGYRVAPIITIEGDGFGAEAQATIDRNGQVSTVEVINSGKQYTGATAKARDFSVLVRSDNTVNNFWCIYAWDSDRNAYYRSRTQGYDTRRYWEYIDWWKEGYGIKSRIVKEVLLITDVLSLDLEIGDLVRIKEFSSGGWAVFEKVADSDLISDAYEIVGREKGTIKMSDTLYTRSVGYDYIDPYDIENYDYNRAGELRNIFKAVKENIFVGDYEVEWNNLFFKAVKYAFVEQPYIDWAFKTSFLTATHNVGNLDQPVNYKIENLDSFESYINEVKPYRTTIREYIQKYTAIDSAVNTTTDFDLPPVYSTVEGKIVPVSATDNIVNEFPWRWWRDNNGYSIKSIEVSFAGQDYLQPPAVLIDGDGTGATAQAFISNGRVSHIVVTNPGQNYTGPPTVSLVGGNLPGSPEAIASPILGEAKVRTIDVGVKFDRITKDGYVANYTQVDTFTASGYSATFNLRYVPTSDKSKVHITVDGQIVLLSEYNINLYAVQNENNSTLYGRIIFNDVPAEGSEIVITYDKNDLYLDAVNRIDKYYDPTSGMKGKVTTQLMTGIDYGGTLIQGTTFDVTGGWDALPWYTDTWDSVESSDDFYVRANGVITSVTLPTVPADGQVITIYYVNNPYPKLTIDFDVAELSNGGSLDIATEGEFVGSDTINFTDATNLISELVKLPCISLASFSETAPNTLTILGAFTGTDKKITISNINVTDAFSDPVAVSGGVSTGKDDFAAVRIDDPGFGIGDSSLVTNPNAIMPTFIGDGSTDTIDIATYLTVELGDTLIFRDEESDGTVIIKDNNIVDTDLQGGDTSSANSTATSIAPNTVDGTYSTATGLTAAEIAVVGGKFVDTQHAPAPEEQIPGQVLDNLSIKVFLSTFGGAAPLQIKTQLGDGLKTEFNVGLDIIEQTSVNVYVEKIRRELGQDANDYSMNVTTGTIEFVTPPAEGELIEIIAIGVGGIDILDYQDFIADGETSLFLTSADYEDTASIFVTVDGDPAEVDYVNSSDLIDTQNKTLVRFNFIPEAGTDIKIISFASEDPELPNLVRINVASYTYDDSSLAFELDNFVNIDDSNAESSILVEWNGTALRGVDSHYRVYDGTNNVIEMELGTLASNISVYVDDKLLNFIEHYFYNGVTRELTIVEENLNIGSTIHVVNDQFAQYKVDGNFVVVDPFPGLQLGDVFDITWFSRYEAMKMIADEYQGGAQEYKLLRQPLGLSYVWVYLNGERLTVDYDYGVSIPTSTLRLSRPTTINDTIKIIVFGTDVYKPTSAYEIHKDILNNYQFNAYSITDVELASELLYYEDSIRVTNASSLPDPQKFKNIPGTVYIDGERIEYMVKDGNFLRQLRRGVAGTATKNSYAVGTKVVGLGRDDIIPYHDEEQRTTFNSNAFVTDFGVCTGTRTEWPIEFSIIDEDAVIVTVNGEQVTNYELDGNLIVWDTDPVVGDKVKATSLMIGPLNYVPAKTERTVIAPDDTTIPEAYGPCDVAEVFVAGTRLRKDPQWQYTEDLGATSPGADKYIDAEFSVNGDLPYVRLTSAAPDNVSITISRRIGQSWYDTENLTLLDNGTIQAQAIAEKTTEIPE